MIYEAFLPIANQQAGAFSPTVFRELFDELAEQFGFLETWPVYRPLDDTEHDVNEEELYRFQLDVPNTIDNRRWLIRWRQTQEDRFGDDIWMIRYRSP